MGSAVFSFFWMCIFNSDRGKQQVRTYVPCPADPLLCFVFCCFFVCYSVVEDDGVGDGSLVSWATERRRRVMFSAKGKRSSENGATICLSLKRMLLVG